MASSSSSEAMDRKASAADAAADSSRVRRHLDQNDAQIVDAGDSKRYACAGSMSGSDTDEEALGLMPRMEGDSERQGRQGRRSEDVGRSPSSTREDLLSHAIDFKHGDTPLTIFDAEGDEEQEAVEQNRKSLDDDAREQLLEDQHIVPSRARSNGYAPPLRPTGNGTTLPGQSLRDRVWHIAREALPTLLISLVSLIFSGELLIHLAKWPVFAKVDKLFILIPILLNLKGNLEGNLTLRMSTSANIGELDVQRTRETLIFGNLALLQVQALIVSLFAGVLSFVLGLGSALPATRPTSGDKPSNTKRMGWATIIPSRSFEAIPAEKRLAPRRVIHKPKIDTTIRLHNSYFEFVLVIATAMLSACLSSAVLGSFMCTLVVMTRQYGINPDNIASPLAGSLGDLLTLSILGLLAAFLVQFEGTILATLILVALAAACVACFMASYRNAYVRELLSCGWVPLVIAMFISSGAGLVLDSFVQRFEGYALLAPAMTGMPGACAAIFVSRTSTALHAGISPKAVELSAMHGRSWLVHDEEPWHHRYFTKFTRNMAGPLEGWLVPCVLGGICFSILLTFLGIIRLTGQMTFGVPFALACSLICGLNVTFGLFVSHCLCLALWRADFDPDIYSLPFVSSIIDVSGQVLLVTAYFIARALGDTITAAVNDAQQ